MARITDQQKKACQAMLDACDGDAREVMILAISMVTTAMASFGERERQGALDTIIDGLSKYKHSCERRFSDVDLKEH